jgi:hypothetical protein
MLPPDEELPELDELDELPELDVEPDVEPEEDEPDEVDVPLLAELPPPPPPQAPNSSNTATPEIQFLIFAPPFRIRKDTTPLAEECGRISVAAFSASLRQRYCYL